MCYFSGLQQELLFLFNVKINMCYFSGLQQELFFFSELSAGNCFWLPKGTVINNTLRNWIKVCQLFMPMNLCYTFCVANLQSFHIVFNIIYYNSLICDFFTERVSQKRLPGSYHSQHLQHKTMGEIWSLAS